MLLEIICDKFKQNRVEFHAGLNTVLGDDLGSNSIGKSTFLMIVDFVFGGKDYVMASTDIQRNIGEHIIKFCFEFNQKKYFYSRDTDDLENVNKCDENYEIQSSISLEHYCEFLKNMYHISLDDISFRNIIGRFSRIYGKENLDEKHPLHIVPTEKAGEPTNALLKIFDLYCAISDLDSLLKLRELELSAYKNAQKYNYLASIGKREYNSNTKELVDLYKQKEQIPKDLDGNLLDLDSLKTDELLKLKQDLSVAKRQRSKFYSQLERINLNISENTNIKPDKFDELLSFFPNAEVRSLSEIENFHKEIRIALKSELKQKKLELDGLLSIVQNEIEDLEKRIKEIVQCPELSKAILIKYASLQKRIELLEKGNSSFEKLNSLNQSKTDAKQRRDKMKLEQLQQLQTSINAKMLEINDYIYAQKKKPPVISFQDNQYTFQTIDDTGTGTSYKSMVVYDLSILELTELPILIHDSVVLKQIADVAIEKILCKYRDAGKQVFISFDKMLAYSEESQKILKTTKVLQLSINGQELFGRSWNDK
ncbi:MAG: DUF2326 domain-containing protein [Oscillospiraceae bacterium]